MYETVELPLQEAIALEAKQNLERDQRVLPDETPDDLSLYREEAEHVLTTLGEGYIPDFPDHRLVKVLK